MTEPGPPPDDDWGTPKWNQPPQPPQQPPSGQWQQPPPPPYGQPPQYGGGQQYGAPPPKIPNYLWQAIAVTILCCLPAGIVAIVYSTQVGSKLGVGNVAGAQQSSDKARMWLIISLVAGLIFDVIYIAIAIAGSSSGSGGGY
jgi:hypothetical protein